MGKSCTFKMSPNNNFSNTLSIINYNLLKVTNFGGSTSKLAKRETP